MDRRRLFLISLLLHWLRTEAGVAINCVRLENVGVYLQKRYASLKRYILYIFLDEENTFFYMKKTSFSRYSQKQFWQNCLDQLTGYIDHNQRFRLNAL